MNLTGLCSLLNTKKPLHTQLDDIELSTTIVDEIVNLLSLDGCRVNKKSILRLSRRTPHEVLLELSIDVQY